MLFFRRFSGGFGSRDYRTSQSGGSTRPGGSVGPRSGGGSYPNYSAPPPTHGKDDMISLIILISVLVRFCFSSLPSARFPISFANADRTKTRNLPSP